MIFAIIINVIIGISFTKCILKVTQQTEGQQRGVDINKAN